MNRTLSSNFLPHFLLYSHYYTHFIPSRLTTHDDQLNYVCLSIFIPFTAIHALVLHRVLYRYRFLFNHGYLRTFTPFERRELRYP